MAINKSSNMSFLNRKKMMRHEDTKKGKAKQTKEKSNVNIQIRGRPVNVYWNNTRIARMGSDWTFVNLKLDNAKLQSTLTQAVLSITA